MKSRWNRKHLLVELTEHIDGCSNCDVATFSNGVSEEVLFQELLDDCVEDCGEDFLRSIWDVDDVEKPHEPWS